VDAQQPFNEVVKMVSQVRRVWSFMWIAWVSRVIYSSALIVV
jgi:hypothetical protein